MYKLHQQDPEQYSIEKLSEKFQLPEERVEAILRVKHLAKEKERSGAPLYEELAKKMDKIFAENEKLYEPYEEETEKPTDRLHYVEREASINQTIVKNKYLARQRAQEKREALKQQGVFGKVIGKNSELGNRRYDFIIVEKSTKKVLVREKDGTLRNGTWEEHEKLLQKYVSDDEKAQH
jgi:hypothetical protein